MARTRMHAPSQHTPNMKGSVIVAGELQRHTGCRQVIVVLNRVRMSTMKWSSFALLMLCVSASPSQAQKKRRCPDTPIDSTNPLAPIYRECHVEQRARPRSNPPRTNFAPPTNGPTCYRASFEFVVDTLGHPALGTVRRVSATDDGFAFAAESTLGSIVYAPARLDRSPVRQIVRFESSLTLSRVVVAPGGRLPSGRSMPRRPQC